LQAKRLAITRFAMVANQAVNPDKPDNLTTI